MSEKINVFVATPTYDRTLDLGFVDSMWVIKENQLTKKEYNEKYNIEFHFLSGSLINRCRNELVGFFLESDFDYMLFIDSDINNFVEPFYEVIDKYIEMEKEDPNIVVGSVYPIKQILFDRTQTLLDNDISGNHVNEYLYNFNLNFPPTNTADVIKTCEETKGWVELSQIGGGFQMFSKTLIKNMIKEYPETFYEPFDNQTALPRKLYDLYQSFVNDGTYLSEDYGFCELVRKMGGKIYGNLYHRLGHRGSHIYTSSAINNIVYTQLSGKTS